MERINTILLILFIGATIVNVAFYIFYMYFAFAKAKKNLPKPTIPISIIICARNEEKCLAKNLSKIINQKYHTFEVIVVNDNSSDSTEAIINSFAAKYENVKQIHIKADSEYSGNKKNALTQGVNEATFNHLLFTDADCSPVSDQWVSLMASQFVNQRQIVLGYGGYNKVKHSFLNKIIRFETVMTAAQYFSWATVGKAYMGVGRNLAYHSSLFIKNNGFEKHMNHSSGDDDLFINQVATNHNTALQFSPDSFTISEPKKTISEWIIQKRRHISTAHQYKRQHQFFLGLFFMSQFFFILLFIPIIFTSSVWTYALLAVVCRYVVSWFVIAKVSKKLVEKDLIAYYPLLEFVLVYLQIGIFIANLISKPKRWK